jgi:hypothetical protein
VLYSRIVLTVFEVSALMLSETDVETKEKSVPIEVVRVLP